MAAPPPRFVQWLPCAQRGDRWAAKSVTGASCSLRSNALACSSARPQSAGWHEEGAADAGAQRRRAAAAAEVPLGARRPQAPLAAPGCCSRASVPGQTCLGLRSGACKPGEGARERGRPGASSVSVAAARDHKPHDQQPGERGGARGCCSDGPRGPLPVRCGKSRGASIAQGADENERSAAQCQPQLATAADRRAARRCRRTALSLRCRKAARTSLRTHCRTRTSNRSRCQEAAMAAAAATRPQHEATAKRDCNMCLPQCGTKGFQLIHSIGRVHCWPRASAARRAMVASRRDLTCAEASERAVACGSNVGRVRHTPVSPGSSQHAAYAAGAVLIRRRPGRNGPLARQAAGTGLRALLRCRGPLLLLLPPPQPPSPHAQHASHGSLGAEPLAPTSRWQRAPPVPGAAGPAWNPSWSHTAVIVCSPPGWKLRSGMLSHIASLRQAGAGRWLQGQAGQASRRWRGRRVKGQRRAAQGPWGAGLIWQRARGSGEGALGCRTHPVHPTWPPRCRQAAQ